MKPSRQNATNPTSWHRGYVSALLRQQELPSDIVTVMHRDIFRRAGITWKDGQRMDGMLASLSLDELKRLADQLREDDGGHD